MGAAWRDVPHGPQFERVLEMVRGVRTLGLEACCTLGMLTQDQANARAEAGLSAYNHNLDTSPEFYGRIITTRTYDDRLQTIARVRQAGITVCCGGIIGLGEDRPARWRLLQHCRRSIRTRRVPVNLLVRVAGTPLADRPTVIRWSCTPSRPHAPDARLDGPPQRGPPALWTRPRPSALQARTPSPRGEAADDAESRG